MSKQSTRNFLDAQKDLRAALPGYESREQQQALAQTIEHSLSTGAHLLAEAGTGCIQGDAEVIINRGGNGKRMTLKTMVERFNHAPGRYQWDPSIPTYIQREHEDGTVRLALVANAWYSGAKQTFAVTTESGRTLRATDEHPFLTSRGWLRLDQIVIGDLVHVRGEQASGRGRQPKAQYLTRSGLVGHPYASRRDATRHPFRRPLHILVAEAEQNGFALDDFLHLLRIDHAQHLTFLDPAIWAVHHKDHDHRNNEPQNLQVLTHADHHRLHADEGKTQSVLYKVTTERVVSVEPYGVEDTYDIEVADDPHNFIVNGFVVHNTGKSLGYLIPAVQSGKRVVISTATKALQDQIAGKDLPFLAEHLDEDFTFAILKGRSNYACQAKVMDPDVVASNAAQPSVLKTITEQAGNPEFLGERDEMPTMTDAEWRGFTTSSENCPGKSNCPFGEVCFAEKAKKKAKESDVVVVNHALFLTDLKVRLESQGFGSMIGAYDAVVFDEAHEIEDYAGNIFGAQFTEAGVRQIGSEIINWVRRFIPSVELADEARSVNANVQMAMMDLWRTLRPGRITQAVLVESADQFVEMTNALTAQAEFFSFGLRDQIPTDMRDQGKVKFEILRARVAGLAGRFQDVVLGDFDDVVRWVEEDKSGREVRRIIKSAPISIDKILRPALFDVSTNLDPAANTFQPTTILTSATLSVGGKFDYIAGRLGIDSHDSIDVGTPFNYGEQARLYVPRHLPDPTRERQAWSSMVVSEMNSLVSASKGRALLLFTSYAAMRAAHDALAPMIPHRVFMQGQMPNKALTREFAADTHSVLFATRSFMTGVDIQGESLSLVVVDKLPFPVPTDPLVESKTDAIKRRGGSDFGEYTIPVMTLVLKQAFGRLIRHRDDRGVVAILDSRLQTKGYGQGILKSLPPAPVLTDMRDVQAFFRKIDGDWQESWRP